MLIPILLLILASVLGFIGMISSLMVSNSTGIFAYAVIAMVAGTAAKLLIRKSL